ncbi:218_t:CDS:2, partial [Funneliformis caledonium]
ESYEIVMGLLKYERLLSESSESIQDFLWSNDNESKTCQKMTTRIIYSPTKKKARTS